MYQLSLSQIEKVSAGTLGEVVGSLAGFMVATPFWIGAILFGANCTEGGAANANFMIKITEGIVYAGWYLGKKTQDLILQGFELTPQDEV